MFVALSSASGVIPNPPDWLQDAVMIDTIAKRYGWTIDEINNMPMDYYVALSGIISAENKKQQQDNLRLNAGKHRRK